VPDYFSHAILAEVIYENLTRAQKAKITSHSLYILGAQGGDIFYAYQANPTGGNLGKRLHAENPAKLFERLLGGNESFLAGFATHYATDSMLHPAVYAYAHSKNSPLAHYRFEADLGLYLSHKFGIARHILPRERVLGATFALYDSMKHYDNTITLTGIERCLKRHFVYTRFLYRNKRTTYKCEYDFSRLDGAIEESIRLGVDAVNGVLAGEISDAVFEGRFLQR
jgi:hypothetical protein